MTVDWNKATKELEKPLPQDHVKTRDDNKQSYIEGWRVIEVANEIFGPGNWSRETVYNKEVCREEVTIGKNRNPGWQVGYEARVRVTVGETVKEGTGLGSGYGKNLFLCIEGAAKEAETDAMKRALMTFGYRLGLALYDKERANVAKEEDGSPAAVHPVRPNGHDGNGSTNPPRQRDQRAKPPANGHNDAQRQQTRQHAERQLQNAGFDYQPGHGPANGNGAGNGASTGPNWGALRDDLCKRASECKTKEALKALWESERCQRVFKEAPKPVAKSLKDHVNSIRARIEAAEKKAAEQPAPAATPPADDDLDIPPFLRRGPDNSLPASDVDRVMDDDIPF